MPRKMIDYAKIETKEKINWLDLVISALILPGVLMLVVLLKLVAA